MKTKHILFVVIGAVILCGFGAFVLILSILLVAADDVEREEAGKLTIAVRHKMFYLPTGQARKTQCVEPEVGVCETPTRLNPETHLVGGSSCQTKINAPQPFFKQPEISDFAAFGFDLEPGKTYYWYIYLGSYEDCGARLPAELERFETGEIKLSKRETKRIEKDFTK